VYLAALVLLAGMPAIVLAGATRRISIRASAIFLAISAPLVGYVYLNPPLVIMIVLTVLLTPLACGWLFGGKACRRGLIVLVTGLAGCGLLSLFWIVPAILQLGSVASSQLASLSSWSWTQGRATLANAFWLNTDWGWSYAAYYPFAAHYEIPPLSAIRFVPAAVAFAALLISPSRRIEGLRSLSLVVVTSSAALLVIFFSTGTNPPGSLLFNALYQLPMGWLLREPGRFLMLTQLMYALLIAISVEAVIDLPWRMRHVVVGTPGVALGKVASVVAIATLVAIPGYPVFTGAIVPDRRPQLPSAHVRLPAYWNDMAGYLNAADAPGGVLVLPPDDFYQMPYRWGYYGNDGFISQLISRPVLVPSSQGYTPAGPQLIHAVNLVAESAIAGNWLEVNRLLRSLGTPLVLIRQDVDTLIPGRNLMSPSALSDAFSGSPEFKLLHSAGPLGLFSPRAQILGEQEQAAAAVTTETLEPDLRVLNFLPENSALTYESVEQGRPNLLQAPPVAKWRLEGAELTWDLLEPYGWAYSLVRLDFLITKSGGPPANVRDTSLSITSRPSGAGTNVHLALTGQQIGRDPTFENGLWQPVGDCNNVLGLSALPLLHAEIHQNGGPDGKPFLRLSAGTDSACEIQWLPPQHRPIFISFLVRHVSGAPPRICLWEVGPRRCARLPDLSVSDRWSRYTATVQPDENSGPIGLFLYADNPEPDATTINDYTDVNVLELPSLPRVDLVGTPLSPQAPVALDVQHQGFSTGWKASRLNTHVLVNGLMNGWIRSDVSPPSEPRYAPSIILSWAFGCSLVTSLALTASLIYLGIGKLRSRRLRQRLSK
jgi:arabinofuranan 3-O-arabinosyltransferase